MPCLCVFFNIGEVPWHCTEHLPRFSQRQAPAIVWRIVGEPWNSIVAIRRKEVIERSEGALTQTWNLWLTFYSFLFCFILVIKLGTTLYSPITVRFLLSVNRAYVNICHHTVSPFKDHKKMVKVKSYSTKVLVYLNSVLYEASYTTTESSCSGLWGTIALCKN